MADTGKIVALINALAGEKVNELKSAITQDMAQYGILTKTAFASGNIDETESENTSVVVRLLGTYKKSNIYQLNFDFNSVVWKSNGTQFLQIKSYSANSTSSTYQVDVIRLDTEAITGNALRVNYSPSTDTVKMIACTFFLGAGVQDIDINVDELSSQLVSDVSELQTEAEHIMPVVELSENTASGTMESTYSTIYIPYNIYAGYRYRLMLACTVGTESGTLALKVWTASARTTSSDYKQDVINDSTEQNPLCGNIKDFATGDSVNEEFVATKNATYFVLQYFGDNNTNYQIGINVGRVASVEQVDEIINGRGIVALNKDVEPLVLQFGREISANTQVHTYDRLNFLFFSDIHAKADLWERICDYMDAYSAIIPFAIHGGDYVSSTLAESSIVDLYGIRKPQNGAILNTVGNHDCIPANGSSPTADAETVYNVLYHSADPVADGWNCTFGTGDYTMYWYKDIADAGVRIICLDQYHWDNDQATFLSNALTGAKTAGYGVITVTHTPITTTGLTDIGSGFWTLDNWTVNDTHTGSMVDIRTAIDAFIDGDGLHIAHLCGHIHSDQICELTEDGIFQIRIQTASANELWTDTRRVLGTKTYDCFNVMQIDRNLGMVKIVRIGCNTSDCLQPRTTLCYDYVNKRVISNT